LSKLVSEGIFKKDLSNEELGRSDYLVFIDRCMLKIGSVVLIPPIRNKATFSSATSPAYSESARE
jgi:hypothetical protein